MGDRADERASQATAVEHGAMLRAMHTLERALVLPSPGREEQWKRRAGAGLTVVTDELRQHAESAEKDGGLLAQVEVSIGRPVEVTLVREDHRRLMDEAQWLLTEIEDSASDPGLACDNVRERATRLTADLRRHQGLEADLILTALEQDIGGGD